MNHIFGISRDEKDGITARVSEKKIPTNLKRMNNPPLTMFPEIQERLVFPFYRPSVPPTVSEFAVKESLSSRSTGSSRRSRTVAAVSMTAGGLNLEASLPSMEEGGSRVQREFIPRHVYSAQHSFGHALVANDVHPLLAHRRVPANSKTSDEIGRHYSHWRHQNFIRGSNFRLPLPEGVSTTVADRFRAQTSLMFQ